MNCLEVPLWYTFVGYISSLSGTCILRNKATSYYYFVKGICVPKLIWNIHLYTVDTHIVISLWAFVCFLPSLHWIRAVNVAGTIKKRSVSFQFQADLATIVCLLIKRDSFSGSLSWMTVKVFPYLLRIPTICYMEMYPENYSYFHCNNKVVMSEGVAVAI